MPRSPRRRSSPPAPPSRRPPPVDAKPRTPHTHTAIRRSYPQHGSPSAGDLSAANTRTRSCAQPSTVRLHTQEPRPLHHANPPHTASTRPPTPGTRASMRIHPRSGHVITAVALNDQTDLTSKRLDPRRRLPQQKISTAISMTHFGPTITHSSTPHPTPKPSPLVESALCIDQTQQQRPHARRRTPQTVPRATSPIDPARQSYTVIHNSTSTPGTRAAPARETTHSRHIITAAASSDHVCRRLPLAQFHRFIGPGSHARMPVEHQPSTTASKGFAVHGATESSARSTPSGARPRRTDTATEIR